MAKLLYEEILKGYRYIGTIDTGAVDYAELLAKTSIIADELSLEQLPLKGDLSTLRTLLLGPWDDEERFIRIPPHGTTEAQLFLSEFIR